MYGSVENRRKNEEKAVFGPLYRAGRLDFSRVFYVLAESADVGLAPGSNAPTSALRRSPEAIAESNQEASLEVAACADSLGKS
jgi:hypothetical protein